MDEEQPPTRSRTLIRILIRFISMALGMRLPDAARVTFYHKDFFGRPMGDWTQAAMRGPSTWSVGERELMAAMVATWNSCSFCIGAHGAIAAKALKRGPVDATLKDFGTAPISNGLNSPAVPRVGRRGLEIRFHICATMRLRALVRRWAFWRISIGTLAALAPTPVSPARQASRATRLSGKALRRHCRRPEPDLPLDLRRLNPHFGLIARPPF